MRVVSNLWNWFRNRVIHLPENLNSGGDWLRLYKEPIFSWMDRLVDIYAGAVPSASVLSNDIVKNAPIPKAIKIMLQLFLIGVIEAAIKSGKGKIEDVIDYLKNELLTAA